MRPIWIEDLIEFNKDSFFDLSEEIINNFSISLFWDFAVSYDYFVEKEIFNFLNIEETIIVNSVSPSAIKAEYDLKAFYIYKNFADIDISFFSNLETKRPVINISLKDYIIKLLLSSLPDNHINWLWIDFFLKMFCWKNITEKIWIEKTKEISNVYSPIITIKELINSDNVNNKFIWNWIINFIRNKENNFENYTINIERLSELPKYLRESLLLFLDNYTYSTSETSNYIIEYVLFNILFLKQELVMCIWSSSKDFFIINIENLNNTLKKFPSLSIININYCLSPLLEIFDSEYIEEILDKFSLKHKEKANKDNIEAIVNFIKDPKYKNILLNKKEEWIDLYLESVHSLKGDDFNSKELKKTHPFSDITLTAHNYQYNKIVVKDKIKLYNKSK